MEGIEKNPSANIATYVRKNNNYRYIKEGTTGVTSNIGSIDQTRFSSELKDVQEATRMLKDMPDIRIQKVAELKGLINNGKYQVDSKRVAYQMIIENVWD